MIGAVQEFALTEFAMAVERYRQRATAVGVPRDRANEVLQEEMNEASGLPDRTSSDAIERASRRIVEENFV